MFYGQIPSKTQERTSCHITEITLSEQMYINSDKGNNVPNYQTDADHQASFAPAAEKSAHPTLATSEMDLFNYIHIPIIE